MLCRTDVERVHLHNVHKVLWKPHRQMRHPCSPLLSSLPQIIRVCIPPQHPRPREQTGFPFPNRVCAPPTRTIKAAVFSFDAFELVTHSDTEQPCVPIGCSCFKESVLRHGTTMGADRLQLFEMASDNHRSRVFECLQVSVCICVPIFQEQ